MNELPDPLQELLRPLPQPEPIELRQRLRLQSGRSVRRRRIVRRTAIVVVNVIVVIGAWVLFGNSMIWLANWSREHRQPDAPIVKVAPKVLDQEVAPSLPEAAVAPIDLEWQAFDSQTNRAANYFLAGNKYLEANQDMESALRCYAQALDACSVQQLDIAPEDNWLVVTLKNARRKEKSHE